MKRSPFSFEEIINAPKIRMNEPEFFLSTDNTRLAYYPFISQKKPLCSLIFIHGSGAFSGGGYQYLAAGLMEKHNINVYLLDMRGHGNSDGRRGDAPDAGQLFYDLKTLVCLVRRAHPDIPLVLGAHSWSCGLVLKYSSNVEKLPVDGYAFIAPFFGVKSGTNRFTIFNNPYTTPRFFNILVYKMSGHRLFGNRIAVRLNYPEEIIKKSPLITTSYTCNFVEGISVNDPEKEFGRIDRPVFMIIGEKDEQFKTARVIDYSRLLENKVKQKSFFNIIEGSGHLSILLVSDDPLGFFLKNLTN